MKSALDPAFLRRLRFVVQFPFPDAAAARGDLAAASSRRDADRRARPRPSSRGCNVAGGNIRNIALNAAFLAAEAGEPVRHGAPAARGAPRSGQARAHADRSGNTGVDMRRVIDIDRLVLKGLRSADRHLVANALREELGRLLRAPEVVQRLSRIDSVPVLRTAGPAVPTGATPGELGASAARAIGNALMNERNAP